MFYILLEYKQLIIKLKYLVIFKKTINVLIKNKQIKQIKGLKSVKKNNLNKWTSILENIIKTRKTMNSN